MFNNMHAFWKAFHSSCNYSNDKNCLPFSLLKPALPLLCNLDLHFLLLIHVVFKITMSKVLFILFLTISKVRMK